MVHTHENHAINDYSFSSYNNSRCGISNMIYLGFLKKLYKATTPA